MSPLRSRTVTEGDSSQPSTHIRPRNPSQGGILALVQTHHSPGAPVERAGFYLSILRINKVIIGMGSVYYFITLTVNYLLDLYPLSHLH